MMDKMLATILKALKSIGLIALIILVYPIILILFNVDIENMSATEDIFYQVIASLLLMGIFGFIYRKDLVNDFKRLKKNGYEIIETGFKYWIIGFGIMIVSNLIINYVFKMGIAGNEEAVRSYLDKFPLFMVFSSVIYAPFTEELAFRKSIRDVVSNKWLFATLSGLIFGLMHIISYVNNFYDLVFIIPYGALGFVFALLYEKTDTIYASMIMHALHNGIAVFIYLLGGI